MVAAQGGPADFVERLDAHLPIATLSKPVFAAQRGIVAAMDTRALGMAVVALGGGRRQAGDAIDHSVGLSDMVSLGERVDAQRPLAVIHANTETEWQQAALVVQAAVTISDEPPPETPIVYRRIGVEQAS